MKIEEIKSYQKKIDVIAKVLKKTDIRDVNSRLDSSVHKVCEAIIGDETGTIYLTLWDNSIDLIQVGKVYDFKNLFSSEFKRSLRLNIGRFGVFEEIKKDITVNDNNFKSSNSSN
jgi:replication factor A1